MPGIVGLITRLPPSEAQRQLDAMLAAVHHEDFYESGTWTDESLGFYVAWTAPRDTFAAGMPVQSENREICLIFSGEDYSDARFEGSGGISSRSSEAAYLVREYERNSGFPAGLNGMFHAAIADRARGEVLVFNDRFGMHRLCYHEASDGFYFGCQGKAILAVRPELRELDISSLGEFASFSCILEDRTVFKGVRVLPAAQVWRFKNARLVRKASYFDPREWEEQDPLSPEDYYRELRATLIRILPRYFSGRQKMGLAITGGFDTRLILACHPPAPGSLPCYTYGGPYRESQDILVGRKIAALCQQSHEVIRVGDDFLRKFPDYAQRTVALTEGTVDVGRTDLFLSEQARHIAPAKIVGTYGSEIVQRAVMFKPVPPVAGLLSPEFLPSVDAAAGTYAAVRSSHPTTFAAFRQSPWYHHGVLALEKSQISVHSPFMDNDFVRTVYRAPNQDGARDIRIRMIRDTSAVLGRVRSDRGLGGDSGRLARKLRNTWLEFTFKAEYAYDYGMPQWVARVDHFFSALRLERLFLGRHKLLHYRVWYRDQLAEYVRQMLLDPLSLSRPYLQKRTVEAIVARHLKGSGNYTSEIHRLLTMEFLHRNIVDGK